MIHSMSFHVLSRRKQAAAFTLTELLISLGIILVFASCLFSGLGTVRSKMQQAACLSQMRQIGLAVLTYANENDMRYPLTDNGAWDVPLASYLDGDVTTANPIMKCPSDKRPLIIEGSQYSRSYSLNVNLPEKTLKTTDAAETILLAEWYTGESGPGGASNNFQYGSAYGVVAYNLAGLPAQYHKTVSNFIFCDGHAESYVPRATVEPTSFWSMR